jgi:hypothetical protein
MFLVSHPNQLRYLNTYAAKNTNYDDSLSWPTRNVRWPYQPAPRMYRNPSPEVDSLAASQRIPCLILYKIPKLKTQVFLDATLCCWVCGSRRCEASCYHDLQCYEVKQFLDRFPFKIRKPRSFATSESTRQRCIVTFRKHWVFSNTDLRTSNLTNTNFVTAFTGSAKSPYAEPVAHALKIMTFTYVKWKFKWMQEYSV